MQLTPAASVAPQAFRWVLVATTKSPVVEMLLMLKAPVPVLVKVTVFGALVSPTTTPLHARDVGDSETAPLLLDVTVKLTGTVLVRLPEVPVTVTVVVPVAAVALAVNVSVLVVLVGFGTKPADTPLGRGDAVSVTFPVKPPDGTTVIVLVPVAP